MLSNLTEGRGINPSGSQFSHAENEREDRLGQVPGLIERGVQANQIDTVAGYLSWWRKRPCVVQRWHSTDQVK